MHWIMIIKLALKMDSGKYWTRKNLSNCEKKEHIRSVKKL